MPNPKKRKKSIIFSVIGVALVALTLTAIFKKKEVVITVQEEKVAQRNLTETVLANGTIQPVVQVTISPEVSGEIIDLPVKEGEYVKKGDLLLKIKPDFYLAALNQATANYQSSLAGKTVAEANLEKAQADFKQNEALYHNDLISDADYIASKTTYDVAKAQVADSEHRVDMAKASVDSARDSLAKTTIVSPLNGTISKLNSQLGERVLGTAQNAGTVIMTIADLNEMEARVDVGEMDVVLVKPGQKARLDVDAFKDRKFNGTVTEIANSAEGTGSSSSQEATKFQVRIHINEKEPFRPGMSVSAEIETRYRTNALTVPIASVTTRPPSELNKEKNSNKNKAKAGNTNSASSTNASTNLIASANTKTNSAFDRKSKEASKPVDVVFVVEGDHVKAVPVKIGICDDNYWEITKGLKAGQEIVSGG
ncbi:MAG TPA: efflux RND transporter periplasmic adaptor subunit, partial [Verrucomicrobiae bacterium]|nr:efflux RND transporter periplasmic adaptor subunit [Verrucomicrobiae bacterium]